MKTKSILLTVLAACALAWSAVAQTNPPTFFNAVQSYFTSFNTNLDGTFGLERGSVWAGVDSIQGGAVPIANALGLSYDVLRAPSSANTNYTGTSLALEGVLRNSGISGTIVSGQVGLGFNIIVHDAKLTLYLDGGADVYDLQAGGTSTSPHVKFTDRLYAEVGVRAQKALTENTFAGIGLGLQLPQNRQVLSAFAGFRF